VELTAGVDGRVKRPDTGKLFSASSAIGGSGPALNNPLQAGW